MHLTIKERVELVLMSGADGVCYYYLNCFICFGALFMAENVCYYYLNCFICFGALFMAHPVYNYKCLLTSRLVKKPKRFRSRRCREIYVC